MPLRVPRQVVLDGPPAAARVHVHVELRRRAHGFGQQARADAHHAGQAGALAEYRRAADRAERAHLAGR